MSVCYLFDATLWVEDNIADSKTAISVLVAQAYISSFKNNFFFFLSLMLRWFVLQTLSYVYSAVIIVHSACALVGSEHCSRPIYVLFSKGEMSMYLFISPGSRVKTDFSGQFEHNHYSHLLAFMPFVLF